MTLLPASILVFLFVWRLHFDLSSKGGTASSYATAGIALRVTGVLKPPHHDKVEPPTWRFEIYHEKFKTTWKYTGLFVLSFLHQIWLIILATSVTSSKPTDMPHIKHALNNPNFVTEPTSATVNNIFQIKLFDHGTCVCNTGKLNHISIHKLV